MNFGTQIEISSHILIMCLCVYSLEFVSNKPFNCHQSFRFWFLYLYKPGYHVNEGGDETFIDEVARLIRGERHLRLYWVEFVED